VIRREFDAEIVEGRGGGAFVEMPFDVRQVFGSARPKVRASFDGHEYRGSLASMGGVYVLGVRKDVRTAIGKEVGDSVHVSMELDTEPRVMEIPPELLASLEEHGEARARFDALSYTHRREYAQWVSEAKKLETRQRRATKAVQMLMEGKRR
jgi:hypothetical protein